MGPTAAPTWAGPRDEGDHAEPAPTSDRLHSSSNSRGASNEEVYLVERVTGIDQSGGTITDLRGLAVLHQDDRSQFTDPGTEDRLRGGNPLQIALQPADLAGAYVFLSSRTNGRGITGTILTVDAGAMLRIPRRTQSNQ